MKKAIILNGLSGNFKTTICNHLKENYENIEVISSPHRWVNDFTNKFFSPKYPILTEINVLMKAFQLESLNIEEGKIYVFDKSLLETIAFNRLISSSALKYNVNPDFPISDENIQSLIKEELKYFESRFDEVTRVLLETHDHDFIHNMVDEDIEENLRSETFWDVAHYLECQEYFNNTFFGPGKIKYDDLWMIEDKEGFLLEGMEKSVIDLMNVVE